jgi:hypothetical protein
VPIRLKVVFGHLYSDDGSIAFKSLFPRQLDVRSHCAAGLSRILQFDNKILAAAFAPDYPIPEVVRHRKGDLNTVVNGFAKPALHSEPLTFDAIIDRHGSPPVSDH